MPKISNTAPVNHGPIDARGKANRQTLIAACEAGFTHCLRTPDAYFFFRSQGALTRKIHALRITAETYPNGEMRYGNGDNLVWLC